MKEKFLNTQTIILSYLTFLVGWTIWTCCNNIISINEYVNWAIGVVVYFIWWLLFAVFFIKRYNNNLMIPFKEMIYTKPKIKILSPLLVFAIVYNIGICFFDSSGFGTKMNIYDLIVTVLTVGIFEESLFRGWFLNAIAHFTSERKANFISSLLFLLAHYPSWIFHGYGVAIILSRSIMLYVLSLIFGWTFIKSRSIWTSTIFHSFWDLISFII